jgi:glycosyltransferase involved in cell wall biosynthesis
MQQPLVSVVIPTCNRYSVVLENIQNINQQEYPTFEILVADDTHVDIVRQNESQIQEIQHQKNVRYFRVSMYDHLGNKTYGLPHARNHAVVEAKGSVLIFLDDRITPDTSKFLQIMTDKVMNSLKRKVWFFGDKGAQKTTFVENCSAVWRAYFLTGGMFCEQIPKYGACTKETFGRYRRQGFDFVYVPEALARPIKLNAPCLKQEKREWALEMREFLRKMNIIDDEGNKVP